MNPSKYLLQDETIGPNGTLDLRIPLAGVHNLKLWIEQTPADVVHTPGLTLSLLPEINDPATGDPRGPVTDDPETVDRPALSVPTGSNTSTKTMIRIFEQNYDDWVIAHFENPDSVDTVLTVIAVG